MNMLIASRAIQGIGGAGMVSLALIVMADIMNERQRSKYIGAFSGTFGLASAIAPVIGGAIVSTSKWQVVFWINVPFCVIALLMITMLLRVPKPRGSVKEKISQIDVIGALLSLAGITLLLLGLSWGGRECQWLSPQVICALAFGGILLVLFVLYEWRIPAAPIVPIRLFRIRNFAVSSAASLLFGFAINGATLFIPQWALVVRNASEITAGAYLLSFCVGMVLSSVICGIVVSKTGRCREAIVVGSALLLLGNCLLLTLDTQGVAKIIGFLFIGGLGVGCCMQPISLIGQASVSGQDMASSTTTFLFFRSLGMVLAVSVLSNVIQNMLHEQATDIVQQFPASASLIARILKNTSLLYTPNVPANLQLAIIEAYSKSIHMAFIVLAAFTGVYFILALGFKHVKFKTVLKPTIR
ncbi:hypothetical protein FBU31_005503 [Coemansia sp. 'formosensis']|nr:hypothetical protein FBU31_005503 [Coemansia sp. 'formosensis']